MNPKNTLRLITTLLFAAFAFSSCSDECERQIENLKDLNKYVPYAGTETLRFLHNSTDTQTFVGQGMERFFVDEYDEGCATGHESVRIRFKNTQSSDEIKMEYVYDGSDFYAGYSFDNKYTYYKFYFNNKRYGTPIVQADLNYSTLESNSNIYDYIRFFYHPQNTLYYFAFRRPVDNNYSGIIKIIMQNDTLEVIH